MLLIYFSFLFSRETLRVSLFYCCGMLRSRFQYLFLALKKKQTGGEETGCDGGVCKDYKAITLTHSYCSILHWEYTFKQKEKSSSYFPRLLSGRPRSMPSREVGMRFFCLFYRGSVPMGLVRRWNEHRSSWEDWGAKKNK